MISLEFKKKMYKKTLLTYFLDIWLQFELPMQKL